MGYSLQTSFNNTNSTNSPQLHLSISSSASTSINSAFSVDHMAVVGFLFLRDKKKKRSFSFETLPSFWNTSSRAQKRLNCGEDQSSKLMKEIFWNKKQKKINNKLPCNFQPFSKSNYKCFWRKIDSNEAFEEEGVKSFG